MQIYLAKRVWSEEKKNLLDNLSHEYDEPFEFLAE